MIVQNKIFLRILLIINQTQEEDEKSLNNNDINNESFREKKINKKIEEEQKEINLNDDIFDDINFASTDFFNTIFDNDNKGENDDKHNEEDEFNSYIPFGNLNTLYENPFCTKEKKGNLDELLKK